MMRYNLRYLFALTLMLSIALILDATSALTFMADDKEARLIADVPADLKVPKLSDKKAAAGLRVKQTLAGYPKDEVYHVLYLPKDWEPGRKYPLIVEYAGNGPYRSPHGDISEGIVEGSRLGYGISEGGGYIWLCLPYLDNEGKKNVKQWWGTKPERDPKPTIDYCIKAVDWVRKTYGADQERVLLCGFSRGAIACNFIGLHNDEIAKLWRGFVVYSHYDGVIRWSYPGSDRESAIKRLKRLKDRPQFILHERASRRGKAPLDSTREFITSSGVPMKNLTFRETGFRNHNDAWMLRPSPARKEVRVWVHKLMKNN